MALFSITLYHYKYNEIQKNTTKIKEKLHTWGARGRKFKSCHPDKSKSLVRKYQAFFVPKRELAHRFGYKKNWYERSEQGF